jgi:hypothetical protein
MYSLDYLLHSFNHKCTAYIMYSIPCITNVQLRLSTPHMLSQMYSLDYLLNRCYHKYTARLSTPQMLSQMYILDYRLHIFYRTCTALIIYSTDLITNVKLILFTPQI